MKRQKAGCRYPWACSRCKGGFWSAPSAIGACETSSGWAWVIGRKTQPKRRKTPHDSNSSRVPGRPESDQYGEIYYHLHGSNFGLTFNESSLIKGPDFGVGLNQGTDVSIALAGPRISFNVPGFRVLSLGAFAYDNFVAPFDRSLDTTYQITLGWDVSLSISSQGANVANQVVFSPQIRWDLGNAMGMKADKMHLGIKYTHCDNKFGICGVDEDSASIFLGLKF